MNNNGNISISPEAAYGHAAKALEASSDATIFFQEEGLLDEGLAAETAQDIITRYSEGPGAELLRDSVVLKRFARPVRIALCQHLGIEDPFGSE